MEAGMFVFFGIIGVLLAAYLVKYARSADDYVENKISTVTKLSRIENITSLQKASRKFTEKNGGKKLSEIEAELEDFFN